MGPFQRLGRRASAWLDRLPHRTPEEMREHYEEVARQATVQRAETEARHRATPFVPARDHARRLVPAHLVAGALLLLTTLAVNGAPTGGLVAAVIGGGALLGGLVYRGRTQGWDLQRQFLTAVVAVRTAEAGAHVPTAVDSVLNIPGIGRPPARPARAFPAWGGEADERDVARAARLTAFIPVVIGIPVIAGETIARRVDAYPAELHGLIGLGVCTALFAVFVGLSLAQLDLVASWERATGQRLLWHPGLGPTAMPGPGPEIPLPPFRLL